MYYVKHSNLGKAQPSMVTKRRRKAPKDRREDILEAAASIFARNGYEGTSLRQIASQVGILSGSIYYHFESKQDILRGVYSKGVLQIRDAVAEAVQGASDDPWDRLSAACEAHLGVLLDSNPFSQVVTPQFTQGLEEPLQSQLIHQRDEYELFFSKLIDKIPLQKNISKQYFRLSLLGSLNWALTWYHPGGDSPKTIAKGILDCYRHPLDRGTAKK